MADWSDEELSSAVAAYREMQRRTEAKLPVNKSQIYRDLAAKCWRRLNTDQRSIFIRRQHPEQTKGGESRTVFINEKLRKELALYVSQTRFRDPYDKFFYTQKKYGKGFTANTLAQHFHYLYKHAGVVGASSHSGRRSFITNLASLGISVLVLASLAGHRNISTTQRYIEVNDVMKRNAVELI